MMAPLFLEFSDALELHLSQIERYGGSTGLRDKGALQSALATPQAGFGDQYFHRDLFEMAAAYLFHITMNHPFVDGNKRTGAAAAVVFLKANGVEVTPPEGALSEMTLGVAEGRLEKPEITAFFRKHARNRR